MKSSILKLAVLLVVVASMTGCATAPSIVSDFKEGDVARVVAEKPGFVIVRNEEVIRLGDMVFISGDMCRLRSGEVVYLWGIVKRPGDYERTFIFNYFITSKAVSHEEDECPSGTTVVMGEGRFVDIMKKL